MDKDFIRKTAAAWVQLDEYEGHPEDYKALLYSFVNGDIDPLDKTEDDFRVEKYISNAFDASFDCKRSNDERLASHARAKGKARQPREDTPQPLPKPELEKAGQRSTVLDSWLGLCFFSRTVLFDTHFVRTSRQGFS